MINNFDMIKYIYQDFDLRYQGLGSIGIPFGQVSTVVSHRGKTDGLTRKQRILDLQPKLSIALQALHTGLTTINHRAPGLKSISPQLSSVQILGWLMIIGDYATQYIGLIMPLEIWLLDFRTSRSLTLVSPVTLHAKELTLWVFGGRGGWCLQVAPRVWVWALGWSHHSCWKTSLYSWDVAGPGIPWNPWDPWIILG